jgi:hypothetical protein
MSRAGTSSTSGNETATEDDAVAELIRLAGWRESPPLERAERIRAAVRTQWRSQVKGRRRMHVTWAAGALAAAAVATWLLVAPPRLSVIVPAPAPPLKIESIVGEVRALDAASGAPEGGRLLHRGDAVEVGKVLETGDTGRVAFGSRSGPLLRLDASSRVRVLPDAVVALDRGAIYVDTGPAGGSTAAALIVRTPLGVLQHVGTQFEVRLGEGALRVIVREGAVRFKGRSGARLLERGSELNVDASGAISTDTVSPSDPEWDWIEAVTPMPDLEGRTLRSFLDWAARERGLELAFADAATEQSASEIKLSGSVQDLTVEEALSAVLPTCSMTHEIEGDRLIVEPLEGSGEPG